jgi:hypothetical protein
MDQGRRPAIINVRADRSQFWKDLSMTFYG